MLGSAADDVVVAVAPFFHAVGLNLILPCSLRAGATVVTMPRFDLAGFLTEGSATFAIARWRHRGAGRSAGSCPAPRPGSSTPTAAPTSVPAAPGSCGRGPQVMRGDRHNPEATAATVDGEGWLRTGGLPVAHVALRGQAAGG